MGADARSYETYSEVKTRLDAIADQVADEGIALDDALDLYEEAVKLAMRASELIETDELLAEDSDDPQDPETVPEGSPLEGDEGSRPEE